MKQAKDQEDRNVETVKLNQKYLRAYSVLAIYFWARGLPQSVVGISNEPQGKTIASCYQLDIASWLRVELHVQFPLSVL